MNILYLFHNYRDGDGASGALNFFLEIDKSICEDYLIVCKRKHTDKHLNIVCDTELETIKSFLKKQKLIIHYIRSAQSNILEIIVKHSNKEIPIITTVVQSPAYKRLLLSPFEIKHTNYFVFIDKTAYDNKIISFIPAINRTFIYLMYSGKSERLKQTEEIVLKNHKGHIIYGRGSTLSKCPKDMFSIFDEIHIENKIFRVVGIPEGDNWVRREAAKRTNIEIYPQLSYKEWFDICKTFDVYLYQLPNDSYASIDGTLGLAMCMRKPVVYMGCDAPKERIIHRESGFIASSVSEMVEYATTLGLNFKLRKSIGEKGRERQIEIAKENNAEERFHKAYKKAFEIGKIKSIPFSYIMKYLFYCYKDIIKNLANRY